ncbi:hypothetical protein K8R78_06990 [bacterium]|nr:hypothetical protein [bacterium]
MKKLLLLLIALPILSSANMSIYYPPKGENYDTIINVASSSELVLFLDSTDPLDRGWAWNQYLAQEGSNAILELINYLDMEKDTDALLIACLKLRRVRTVPEELRSELNHKLQEMLGRIVSDKYLPNDVITDLLHLLWCLSPDDAWAYIEDIYYADWARSYGYFKSDLLGLVKQYQTESALDIVKDALLDDGYLGSAAVSSVIYILGEGDEAADLLYEKVIQQSEYLHMGIGERGVASAASYLAKWGDERMLFFDLNALSYIKAYTAFYLDIRLKYFNTPELRDTIYSYYQEDGELNALMVLWSLNDERAVKPFLLEIASSDWLFATDSQQVLSSLNKEMRPLVLDFANNVEEELQQGAWLVLTAWREPGAIDFWTDNFSKVQFAETRKYLLQRLFHQDDKEAAVDIFYWAAINDPDESIRKQAQRFLDRTN